MDPNDQWYDAKDHPKPSWSEARFVWHFFLILTFGSDDALLLWPGKGALWRSLGRVCIRSLSFFCFPYFLLADPIFQHRHRMHFRSIVWHGRHMFSTVDMCNERNRTLLTLAFSTAQLWGGDDSVSQAPEYAKMKAREIRCLRISVASPRFAGGRAPGRVEETWGEDDRPKSRISRTTRQGLGLAEYLCQVLRCHSVLLHLVVFL